MNLPADLVEAEIEESLQAKRLSETQVQEGKAAFRKGIALAETGT